MISPLLALESCKRRTAWPNAPRTIRSLVATWCDSRSRPVTPLVRREQLRPVLRLRADGLFERPATLEAMANRMLPSTTVDHERQRFGVFWEVYGVASPDTVHYALVVTSTRPSPLLARAFAGLTGRTTVRAGSSVEIRWDRALTATALRRDTSTFTTLPDGLVLSLPELPTGNYRLELRASTSAATPTYRAVRTFTVR